MTIARAQLVDLSVTRWYHCVARCVRRASLLAEGPVDRKEWIERRLKELAEIFAVSVGAFSVLDNQVHVLMRLDPDIAKEWSDKDVVVRWGRLTPPRDKRRQVLPVSKQWIESQLEDAGSVATARERLQSLGWFMKYLKEPLSRLANRQDETRGAFFEERFKSVAILDEESLLAVCTYIDLSPVAAGLAKAPEASRYTSIRARIEHAKAAGRLKDLKAAPRGRVAGSRASSALEESLWLCPIEDRRGLDSSREGMIEGMSLGGYLLLADYTARMFREEKATTTGELSAIFDRLGSSEETWCARMEKLSHGRLFGRFFAASRQRLREVAGELGMHHVANLGGCPTR
jgi:hypothetical protein